MADTKNDLVSLGPWANADLNKTAKISAGIGADDRLPQEIRFVANVAKLIRRRVAQPGSQTDPHLPAVFLLKPSPIGLNLPKPPTRMPMLDNGLTSLCGRVWLVGAGPASGHYTDYEASNDDDLFKLVIAICGEGSHPALIFDPRPAVPEARFYPKGLAQLDDYHSVSVVTENINVDRVLTVIDSVYNSNLITPEAQPDGGKLWHDQAKWRPSAKAEAIVQLNLKAGLAGAFPTCTIRHEQHMPEGRLDLEIEQSDPVDRSKVTRHAILELKVLRTFGETGHAVTAQTTLDWVESGLKQAAAYRDSKGALWSALFCFDMRKEMSGQKCFNHVSELAKTLNVLVRCWHLFATSKLYRDALAANA